MLVGVFLEGLAGVLKNSLSFLFLVLDNRPASTGHALHLFRAAQGKEREQSRYRTKNASRNSIVLHNTQSRVAMSLSNCPLVLVEPERCPRNEAARSRHDQCLEGTGGQAWSERACYEHEVFPVLGRIASIRLIYESMWQDLQKMGRRRHVLLSVPASSQSNLVEGGNEDKDQRLTRGSVGQVGGFDAMVDFDEVVRDPNNRTELNPVLSSGDCLHPSPEGYQVIADALPVELFERLEEGVSTFIYT